MPIWLRCVKKKKEEPKKKESNTKGTINSHHNAKTEAES